jgi:hypothetical protein
MGVSATRRHTFTERTQSTAWLMHQQYFARSIGFQNMELAAKLVARIAIGRQRQSAELFHYREI